MHTTQARTQGYVHICRSAAILTGLSILLAITGLQLPILYPMGNFLFHQFHLAALYVPAIFFFSTTLIRSGRFSRVYMGLIWFSSLPFLTAAMMFQIIAGRNEYLAPGFIIGTLGRVAGAMLFFFMLAMEITVMVKTFMSASGKNSWPNEGKIKLFINNILESLGLSTQENPGEQERQNGEYTEFSVPPVKALEEEPWPVSVLSFEERLEEPISASPPEPVAPPSPTSAEGDEPASEMLYNLLNPEQDEPEPYPQHTFAGPGTPVAQPEEIYYTEDLAEEFPPEETLQVVNLEDMKISTLPELLSQGMEDWMEEEAAQESPQTSTPHTLQPEAKLDGEFEADIVPPHTPRPEAGIAMLTATQPPQTPTPYILPEVDLLDEYPDSDYQIIDEATREGARILERTLREFKIEARVTGISKGPVITMYEIFPSSGVKLSSIMNLQDNIALQLAASSVRIVAPIPGKHAVGIEIPNRNRAIVSFRSLMESNDFHNHEAAIPVVLGKDLGGGNEIMDLTRTPHLLIAGATGSGKSVCVNTLISSILYSRKPDEVKMIMVDPKIVELKLYNGIPHLLTPVITNPKRAFKALQWCLSEMERRYQLLDQRGVRGISSYNQRETENKLPYIVVIVDEFADLMATSGKQLEGIVARLAPMSRAVGIHLVLATQRPSVDVITGLIKANFPSRIAFMVAAKTDSRIIIDTMGAEKLMGRGDMLFVSSWHPFPQRIQGTFMSEEEAERLSNYIKTLGEPQYLDEDIFMDDEDDMNNEEELEPGNEDPMYHEALEVVLNSRKASASYLQRRLKLGYNRAARLIEEMEKQGILGPPNGSKPREILRQQPEKVLAGV